MLTILTSPSPAAFARARTAAHKMGLPFEPIAPLRTEITFQDPTKVLAVIKEAGGTISRPLHSREMTRAEML
jgi:hypothetical protein